jgi:hypothetical protein
MIAELKFYELDEMELGSDTEEEEEDDDEEERLEHE